METFDYIPNRISALDGSDAMFVCDFQHHLSSLPVPMVVLVNECGDEWVDVANDWLTDEEAYAATWVPDGDRGCWTVVR